MNDPLRRGASLRPFSLAALGLAAFLAACGQMPRTDTPAPAADPAIALPQMRLFPLEAARPPTRPNSAMARDILDLTFALESGRRLSVLTRFEGPIRVRMTGTVPPTAPRDLAALITRLRREAGLDIAAARAGEEAEITVEFLPGEVLHKSVPRAACFVAPRVASWAEFRRAGGATLDWTTLRRRDRAAVFIPADTAPQEVRDCLHEEVAQAVGPLNDLFRLPDSIFNDDNLHTVLTGFDMLTLRAIYAPELTSGMSEAEVAARLPRILARLNPRGARGNAPPPGPTPMAYVTAVQTALGTGTSERARQAAARKAVMIAASEGWLDERAGFALLVLGRISLGEDAEVAQAAFLAAEALYDRAPGYAIQSAYVDMQLSAFALAAGRSDEALARTARAMPAAEREQNAALLSSLGLMRAAALGAVGRDREAARQRLDSLGWARYGFASDDEVIAQARNIAALSPIERTRQE